MAISISTGVPVSRWSRAATVTTAAAAVALAALAAAPYLVGTGVTQPLVTLFLLVSMPAYPASRPIWASAPTPCTW